MTEIESDRRREEREARLRADLHLNIEITGEDALGLIVENRGGCIADEVRIDADVRLGAELKFNLPEPVFPISVFPGERRTLPLRIESLDPKVAGWSIGQVSYRIVWTDGTGNCERSAVWVNVPEPPAIRRHASAQAEDLDETRRLIYMLRPQLGNPKAGAASLELASTVFNALLHHSAVINNDERAVLENWAAIGFPNGGMERRLRSLFAEVIRRITYKLGDGHLRSSTMAQAFRLVKVALCGPESPRDSRRPLPRLPPTTTNTNRVIASRDTSSALSVLVTWSTEAV